MPLETYTGSSVDALLARAERELGEDAVVLHVRPVRDAAGAPAFELVAGDPASVARAQNGGFGPDGSSRLTVMSPGPGHVARPAEEGGPVRIAFVGPTGAGKTTTIAKLMSHPKAFGLRRVGIVSLDTYRVGAVEQSRTYAELAQVPLEIVYEAADLEAAFRRLGDCEVVLVDTPGRGPRSQKDRDTVQEWLSRIAPHETHLVLPAGLQPELARRTVELHRRRGATHLLASKLDELPDDWSLFELAAELGLPMRWMADGQEVPADLRPAAPRLLSLQAARAARAARGAA